jgi:hypothetical protein
MFDTHTEGSVNLVVVLPPLIVWQYHFNLVAHIATAPTGYAPSHAPVPSSASVPASSAASRTSFAQMAVHRRIVS